MIGTGGRFSSIEYQPVAQAALPPNDAATTAQVCQVRDCVVMLPRFIPSLLTSELPSSQPIYVSTFS